MINKIIYDGNCKLCKRTIKTISFFSKSFEFDPNNREEEVIYIEDGKVYRGFYAIRRIILKIPIFWLLLPIFYFPFFDKVGTKIYNFISKHRRWI
ncbi:MAG: DUF393 domain-containing protein [candidate division WOR-3 bacterium]